MKPFVNEPSLSFRRAQKNGPDFSGPFSLNLLRLLDKLSFPFAVYDDAL